MALDRIIRRAVARANRISKPVQGVVSHVTWTGQTGYGQPTTVTVKRECLIEKKLHQRRLTDGSMVQVEATLTFLDVIPPNGAPNRDEPIDRKDKFILPGGLTGVVLDLEGLDNGVATSNPFYVQVFLGYSTGGVQ